MQLKSVSAKLISTIVGVVLLLSAFPSSGISWHKGYYIHLSGDTIQGEVKYRKIDVPRKAFFRTENGHVTDLRVTKVLEFGCAKGVYRRVVFRKSHLGWADTFFMEQKIQTPTIDLYYGKIMSEGCGCGGVPYQVSHEWVMSDSSNSLVILEFTRLGRIRNPADAAAAFLKMGHEVDAGRFKYLKDVKSELYAMVF